jgi:hypothetical protein
MACDAMPQLHPLNFAGCTVAESIDENDVVGHPPFGDPAFKMRRVDCLITFAPAAVTTTSNGVPSHVEWRTPITAASTTARASHPQVFDVDRTDPFTA